MDASNRPLVVAIAGPTASGKSTLISALKERYMSLIPVYHISQDDFYIDDVLIESTGQWKNWDIPSSLCLEDFSKAVEASTAKASATEPKGIVFVEGILLFSHPDLIHQYNSVIALNLDEAVFRARRFNRDAWIRENEAYFDEVVLPAHQIHGTIPLLPHCRQFQAEASLPTHLLHQSVFEQLEAWRNSSP